MSDDYQRDLPALLEVDPDLPVVLPGLGPKHKEAPALAYAEWTNLASQRHVRGIAASRDGELWLATGGGVLVWRPLQRTYTRYASQHGLPGNVVSAVAVDGSGRAWALASGTLIYLDSSTWRWHPLLDDVSLSCLTLDLARRLWVGSATGVYSIAGPDTMPQRIEYDFALRPRGMAATARGDILVWDGQGLYRYDCQANGWRNLDEPLAVFALAVGEKYLWMGTQAGLWRMDLQVGHRYRAASWPAGPVQAIAPAGDGAWVALEGEIGFAEEASWRPIPTTQRALRVTGLIPAGPGNVWVGTHDGLLRGRRKGLEFQLTEAAPDVFELFDRDVERPPATFSNLISALAVQQTGAGSRLLIGTAQGTVALERSTDQWTQCISPSPGPVTALLTELEPGRVLEASWTGGLRWLSTDSGTSTPAGMSEPALALAAGPGHWVWVATPRGLCAREENGWRLHLTASDLRGGIIRALRPAGQDRLLIGTSAGLFAYRPADGALEPLDLPAGASEVRAVLARHDQAGDEIVAGTAAGLYAGSIAEIAPLPGCEDWRVTTLVWDEAASKLWVGAEDGLRLLSREATGWHPEPTLTPLNSGLAGAWITALLTTVEGDGKHYLWAGTRAGLSRLAF